jgi:hypothetical protein
MAKKTRKTSGPVRIDSMKARKAPAKKRKTVSVKPKSKSKSPYQFVTDNFKSSGLKSLQATATHLLQSVQKRVSEVLAGDETGKRPQTNAELRKAWVKKRLARTRIGKAIQKKVKKR